MLLIKDNVTLVKTMLLHYGYMLLYYSQRCSNGQYYSIIDQCCSIMDYCDPLQIIIFGKDNIIRIWIILLYYGITLLHYS